MRIAVLILRLHAPWAHSLKEKRSIVQGLLAGLRRQFNVSAAESGDRDAHAFIELTLAAVVAGSADADRVSERMLRFIERTTDAELFSVERQLL